MGLDQYLYAEKYVSGYAHNGSESQSAYQRLINEVGLGSLASTDSPSATVSVCVAYWRKANAVHNWFVQNVQGGVDECQRSYVSQGDLAELIKACEESIRLFDTGDLQAAEEVLTPTSGFFFGSTEMDEYYKEDLEQTIKMLKPLLEFEGPVDFAYQASW